MYPSRNILQASFNHFVLPITGALLSLENSNGQSLNVGGGFNKYIPSGKFIHIQDMLRYGFNKNIDTNLWEPDFNLNNLNRLKSLNLPIGNYVQVDSDKCEFISNALSKCTQHINAFNYLIPRALISDISNIKYYKSYLDDEIIMAQKLKVDANPSDEFEVKGLFNALLSRYFKTKHFYLLTTENQTNLGRKSVDIVVKYGLNLNTFGLMELKSLAGEPWWKLLNQNSFYADNDRTVTNPILFTAKATKVAFFLYVQDWHSDNGFDLKFYKFNGLLGLYFDREGVKILPQENTFYPQIMFFDMFDKENPVNIFSVLCALHYFSTIKSAPSIADSHNQFRLSHHTNWKHSKSLIGTLANSNKEFYMNGDGKLKNSLDGNISPDSDASLASDSSVSTANSN